MKIGRMIAPVHALGPGKRVCLWMQGCTKHCYNCIAPELQSSEAPSVPVEHIAEIILETAALHGCNRLTISGGDPLEQAQELEQFLVLVRGAFSDILVYTGYLLSDIQSGDWGAEALRCLHMIDVLIDGPYEDINNTSDCVLRGSKNQKIHYLNAKVRPEYAAYLAEGRKVETFAHNGNVLLIGILNRGG